MRKPCLLNSRRLRERSESLGAMKEHTETIEAFSNETCIECIRQLRLPLYMLVDVLLYHYLNCSVPRNGRLIVTEDDARDGYPRFLRSSTRFAFCMCAIPVDRIAIQKCGMPIVVEGDVALEAG